MMTMSTEPVFSNTADMASRSRASATTVSTPPIRAAAGIVTRVRALAELTDVDDPCWAYIAELIAGSLVPVEVLAPDLSQCEACLHQLQVTARSALGSVVLNTGGMLVDHG